MNVFNKALTKSLLNPKIAKFGKVIFIIATKTIGGDQGWEKLKLKHVSLENPKLDKEVQSLKVSVQNKTPKIPTAEIGLQRFIYIYIIMAVYQIYHFLYKQ